MQSLDAPGEVALVDVFDGTWTVRTGSGTGRGLIDTGSGSVDIVVE